MERIDRKPFSEHANVIALEAGMPANAKHAAILKNFELRYYCNWWANISRPHVLTSVQRFGEANEKHRRKLSSELYSFIANQNHVAKSRRAEGSCPTFRFRKGPRHYKERALSPYCAEESKPQWR